MQMQAGSVSPGKPLDVLYARDSDGSHPVHIYPAKYTVVLPAGAKSFRSKRQLLIALTGHPKARNWTFDRYFKLDDEPADEGESLLDWFRPVADPVSGQQAASLALKAAECLTSENIGLGIDLVGRSDEVAKLLFAGFGSWIRTSGYDPQEVLQEVYAGLLVRNQGKCPWDGNKSSFGHYVHLVCRGVMSNYHRKLKRRREHEQTGLRAYDGHGEYREQDVASTPLVSPPTAELERFEMLEATDDLLVFIPRDPTTHLARAILPYLRDGYTRSEIARALKVPRTQVAQAQSDLQSWAARWYTENGVSAL